jgi:hypothetical protein
MPVCSNKTEHQLLFFQKSWEEAVVFVHCTVATTRSLLGGTPDGGLRQLARSPERLSVLPNPQKKPVNYYLHGKATAKDAKTRNEQLGVK